MKKKMLLLNFAYYILSTLVYACFFLGSAKLFHTTNLGAAIALAYAILFVGTPILVVVLVRFSLFKWYVDPIAAAEIPLFLFVGMILTQMNRSQIDFYQAFLKVNETLSAKDGEGWIFLIGLFLFGLVASFSFARKNGESISYRLISKFSSKEKTV